MKHNIAPILSSVNRKKAVGILDILAVGMYISPMLCTIIIKNEVFYGKDSFGDRIQPGDRCGNR